MFTRAEKGYLALSLGLLAAGSGLKAWRLSGVRIGPFQDPTFTTVKTAKSDLPDVDSSARTASETVASSQVESLSPVDSVPKPVLAVNEPVPPKPKSAFTGKVDLNRAAAAELTQVKGIGAKTALAIVAYRTEHGPFRELRDLLQVKGIGEKKLEKLGPYLIL
jgi:competence ComEA-like helix-hairpin-helix protein